MINSRYILICNIILSILLTYLVINTSLNYLSIHADIVKKYTVNRTPVSQNKSVEKKFDYYKIIIDRDIFRSFAPVEVKEIPKPVTPPKITEPKIENKPAPPPKPLNLKLKGTIVGLTEDSFAIIENTAKKIDEFYKVNAMIKDTDAKIIDIARNVVTLQIGDRTENIYVYDEDKNSIRPISHDSNKPKTVLPSRGPRAPVHHPPQSAGERDKNFVVNRTEMIDSMGGDINQIIDKVMASVDINPYIENGKFMGYSINNLESLGGILTGQGLENGDIIKEVNGIKLESAEKLFELYQVIYPELQSLSSVQVVLSRKGTDMSLNYSINQ
ncbi:hypothetical protein HZA55_05420 [Candidatus Poribacteria bacterium]|nr:hypothetical protein [Candidatus Poribacteria bacterium]